MSDGLKPEQLEPCTGCGKGVMHAGNPMFFRVGGECHLVDIRAVQQIHGLEMAMGKAAPLAQIFSPVSEVSARVSSQTFLVCLDCATTTPLAALMELAAERVT